MEFSEPEAALENHPAMTEAYGAVGSVVAGRYRLVALLGEGGMGVAYRAWDQRDGLPVVIKMPKRALLEAPEFVQRFSREINAMAALRHPHIVPILDAGADNGQPFAAMRFLPGGSLANRRLRDSAGRPRPNHPSALHLWLPAMATALDFIHSRGVVHRDVKPSNVFFDAFWGAYLGDFGIAKIVQDTTVLEKEQTLTGTNTVLGTQEYMAPEQFSPRAVVDGHADQYALAVMVYEMVCGARPFTGELAHIIVEHTAMAPPPLKARRPELPDSLCEAVHRGLAKLPSERFSGCLEFANAVLRDVAPLADQEGVARLLCPKFSTILKLPPSAANRVGNCPRCRASMAVASDFAALWLIEEEAGEGIRSQDYSDTPESTVSLATSPTPWGAVAESSGVGAGGVSGIRSAITNPWRRLSGNLWPQPLAAIGAVVRESVLEVVRFPFGTVARTLWKQTGTRLTLVSVFIAAAAMVIVMSALYWVPKTETPQRQPMFVISSSAPEVVEEFEEFEEELPQDQPNTPQQDVANKVLLPDATVVTDVQVVADAADGDWAGQATQRAPFHSEVASGSDLLEIRGLGGGQPGGLSGRSGAQRQKLVQSGGGSAQSEAAVEAALKWLIQHQMRDGGWSFDLSQCPSCQGQCSASGDEGHSRDRCGATALTLLPFLGRGYTHKEGPYKSQLEAGINYLATLAVQGQGKAYGKKAAGNMYSQGLAGIALAESYGMTTDARLAMPAQLALNYIMSAQDPVGGGWRYSPKQPGDTSATGWQLMALKAGHRAFLQVNPLTIKKTVEFLNAVQASDGATYGYEGPGEGVGTSAVGLLCRMHLGWKKDHPALQRGAARLAKLGPTSDLYYDYYATQVLHHMEGDMWVAWNTKMRDMLVRAQAKQGHEAGSWYDDVDGGHGPNVAGRLYCTSLATLILEVYYRHLPLYSGQSMDGEFKE